MKKLLFVLLGSYIALTSFAQVTVVQGGHRDFAFKKQPSFASISLGNEYYYVFKSYESAAPVHTLLTLDRQGNMKQVQELRIDVGTFNNSFGIVGVYGLGNNLVAAVENPDKTSGLNRLSLRTIENGKLNAKDIPVGSMEFKKLMNQGNWFVTVTPDKNHLAIVGQMPREKDEPNQYKYFFLDASMKLLKSGTLSFPNDTRKVHFNYFYASDKGDLYLVEEEFDKTYRYPNVYKSSIDQPKGTIVPVQPTDASNKIMSYTARVNEAGDLLLAGYFMKKKSVVVGDEEAKGSWWYTMSKGEMLMNDFEKPVANMKAHALVQNGDTWFLMGEQLKTEREKTTQQGMNFEENFNFKHNDILVTAFDTEGTRKFDIPLSKSFSARNFNQDLYPAYGIVNGKLAVVYNDQYGKYIPNTGYSNYKLPVLVLITNDGLMEQPVHFQKELNVTSTPYTLYPQFFTAGNNELMLLSGNGISVKGVVFSVK